ncbi:MAG: hypothetical protein RL563_1099 [Pseudomonadota bacterium]|jgi:hypothetical protein
MAISTYSELVSAIGNWIHRTDLGTVIPDFIRLAESRMQNDLDIRQLDVITTVTTTGGTNVVSLPTNFNQMKALSITSGGIVQVLDFLQPEMLLQKYGSQSSTFPRSYAIRGSNLLLGPTPDGAYSLSMEYQATITGLTVSNATNDVLTAYPEAYLHCALIYAGQYTRDVELVAGMEQLYAADVTRINGQNWAQQATMSIKTG